MKKIFGTKTLFLLAGYKMQFIDPCGANKSIFPPPPVEKKLCATREKHLFYSRDCYSSFVRASNFTLAKSTFSSLVVQYTIISEWGKSNSAKIYSTAHVLGAKGEVTEISNSDVNRKKKIRIKLTYFLMKSIRESLKLC